MAENVPSSAAASLRSSKTSKELENTVLLGRGKSHLNHPGNKYFQDLVTATVDAYAKEPSVFVKRQMTLKIVEQIEEKGGFLRWSSDKGDWEAVDDLEERRQKVAHALQYRIRQMNNTNGGKRARMKAGADSVKKAKSGASISNTPPSIATVATTATDSVTVPVISTPQQVAAMVKAVVPSGVTTATPESKGTMLQLTEDEKLIVRNFVHSKEEEDDESSAKIGSGEVALAAQLVASEATAVTSAGPSGSVPLATQIAQVAKDVGAATVESKQNGPSPEGLSTTTKATAGASLLPASEQVVKPSASGTQMPVASSQTVDRQVETACGTEGPNTPTKVNAEIGAPTKVEATSSSAVNVPSPLDTKSR